MEWVIALLAGLAVGGVVAWLVAAARGKALAAAAEGTVRELRAQVETAAADAAELRVRLEAETAARVKAETELAEAAKNLEEQRKLLEEAKARLTDTFKALSADALKSSSEAFLTLAKKSLEAVLAEGKGDLEKRKQAVEELVKPIRESLKAYEERIREVEKSRKEAYGGLQEQMKALALTHQRLEKETHGLSSALRNPQQRGAWGEMTLRRVVELAGMSEHCDFTEQTTLQGEGGALRPDLLVNLPGGRRIAVDAKTPLISYLEAVEAESEDERQRLLKAHARHTRDHMVALSRKAYWEQLQGVDLVVMFIPGEPFFGAAVAEDHALIEDGMANRVVVATPATLIVLLHTAAYSWRQEAVAENAQKISKLGRDLHDRMRVMAGHLADIGKGLDRAVEAYNRSVGSLERRVLTSARRFQELGAAAGDEIPAVDQIETTPRRITPPGSADDGE